MNHARLLMFAALLMACAGFLMLSQTVHAGPDEFWRATEAGLVLAR